MNKTCCLNRSDGFLAIESILSCMENPKDSEVIRLNPLGPHFYVNDGRPFRFPEGWRDAITDRMNEIIGNMDDMMDVPVTHEHIKAHVEITTVEWDDDDFEIQPFDIDESWYSEEELYDFDF